MAKTIRIKCGHCGAEVDKPAGEVRRSRKLGRSLFCSRTCSGHNANKGRRNVVVKKVCPHCGNGFESNTGAKAATFCSRSCASAGSVTDLRREKQRESGLKTDNLISVEEALRLREGWKYAGLKTELDRTERDYQFEYRLGSFIFDLVLLDVKILVEFDGPYHAGRKQERVDLSKEDTAKEAGFSLVRIFTEADAEIPYDVLEGY